MGDAYRMPGRSERVGRNQARKSSFGFDSLAMQGSRRL